MADDTTAAAFKPGDTVALKSGGTAMTVYGVDETHISTSWFDEAGKYYTDEFISVELAPITRKAIHIDEATIRHVWVFADTGEPIADHIAMRVQASADKGAPTASEIVYQIIASEKARILK